MFWKPPPRRSSPNKPLNHLSFSTYGKKLEDFGDPKRAEAIAQLPDTPNPSTQWQDPFEKPRSKPVKSQRPPEKQLKIRKAKPNRDSDTLFLQKSQTNNIDQNCIIRKAFKNSSTIGPELYINRQLATIESNHIPKNLTGIRVKNREP